MKSFCSHKWNVLFSIFLLLILFPQILSTKVYAEEAWKEAYIQGQKFLETGKWEDAIRSFQKALQIKDRDDKSLRLYGMRFGYFPHRDKGIAHYHLGQWEESIRELNLSIQQSKSDQADQYLDLAVKASEKSRQGEAAQIPEEQSWKGPYLQALEFMESERWRDAISAFEKALQFKNREDESLKLYGMRHGYFPHREKGIAHYRLQEWQISVKELETSLAQAPSDRASEYLDLAKNRKITVDTSSVFRENWWNYYERGILLAGKGAWMQAIEDFQNALSKQDKNIKDTFRARTYGMRFIDYFPHRELGVAFYQTRQFQKAIQELETSLSMAYTAKAAFFLNQARKELLKTSKVDRTPPQISIKPITPNLVTNLFSAELTGVAEDENFVSSIWVNNRLLFIELAEKKVSFTRSVPLNQGENKITVQAEDLMGNKTSQTITVKVDREGPIVVLDNFADGETVKIPDVTLKGLLVDDLGTVELAINDQPVPIKQGKDIKFNRKLSLRKGENSIKIRAKDPVGNTTEDVIHLNYDPTFQEPKIKKTELYWLPKVQYAVLSEAEHLAYQKGKVLRFVQNDDAPYRSEFGIRTPQAPGSFPEVIQKWKGVVGENEKFGEETPQARPPVVKLKDLGDEQTAFLEKFFIEGKAIAVGSAQVDLILINEEPLETKPGKSLLFSHLVELKEGENLFKITVIDTGGKQTEKKVKIIRQIPRINRIGSRMSIAILPFEQKGEAFKDVGNMVYDALINAFVNQERFKIVGRKEELKAALEELKLSQTGLVDPTTAVKPGKIVAAETVMVGNTSMTEKYIEVVARLVNTETTEILASKDVYDQYEANTLLEKINFLMEGLTLKFMQEFPLVQGEVVKIEGLAITTDLGTNHHIRKDMRFIVFREGEVLKNSSGKVLGSETQQLGEAKVEEVFENFSKGQILVTPSQEGAIKPQDKVITK
jgi:tetratricopeptide (TPR) repeat protein